jgi:hypothetical protein
LSLVAASVAALAGLSSGAAFAAQPRTAAHPAAPAAAAQPDNCAPSPAGAVHLAAPLGTGREVYYFQGMSYNGSGVARFAYQGDGGDWLFFDHYMGEYFVKFCI